MKACFFILFLFICPVFFLSGCLDCERVSLSVDLVNKVTEVKYFNIVSNSKDEDTIKKDFRELIKKVYFDDDSKSNPDRITSKRLYRNNEQLDGMVQFSFKHPEKVIKEFEIKTDKKGDYILDITKDIENYQVSGNGQYAEKDSKKIFKWRKNVKEIKLEMKTKVFDDTKKTSLLKYWLDWVDINTKE